MLKTIGSTAIEKGQKDSNYIKEIEINKIKMLSIFSVSGHAVSPTLIKIEHSIWRLN